MGSCESTQLNRRIDERTNSNTLNADNCILWLEYLESFKI